MNVLILTGRFGQGHVSAARAIEGRLARQLPQARVTVVDFLSTALGSDTVYRAFELLVSHGEQLFNRFYYRSESGEDKFGVPMKHFCFAALARMLEQHRPDVVVSTLPLTTQLAGAYKASGRGSYTLVVAVTDTALHGDWVTPAADAYLAPGQDVREGLLKAGIPRHSIFVTGVPVGPQFYPGTGLRQGEDLGQTRHLLILGGGLGLVPQDLDFYAALDGLPGVRTTVVCGRNQRLYSQLNGRLANVEAVGLVDDMAERMRSAHLALGKPGGVTLFEAIACRLPFLATQPFLAQEMSNARFIQDHGLGGVLEAPAEDSVGDIRRMIWDTRRLEAARQAMAILEAGFDQHAMENLVRLAALTRAA